MISTKIATIFNIIIYYFLLGKSNSYKLASYIDSGSKYDAPKNELSWGNIIFILWALY